MKELLKESNVIEIPIVYHTLTPRVIKQERDSQSITKSQTKNHTTNAGKGRKEKHRQYIQSVRDISRESQ